MMRRIERFRRERGSVLIHVTVVITGLVAFSALTIDYGIMWLSRRQAQNAADAAALGGAISLAFDAPGEFDRARAMAKAVGEQNEIFNAAPNITQGSGNNPDITQDISFPTCPVGAPGLPDTCVRVNVYRNQVKDPLPTFFARIFGRTTQGVQATATAQVLTGNATDCLKPWAVGDKWQETVECTAYSKGTGACTGTWEANDVWTTDSTFDKYTKSQGGMVLDGSLPSPPGPDYYVAPTEESAGTGFQPFDENGEKTADYGLQIALKIGSNENRLSSGWFLALDLPGCATGDQGANCYQWNIKNCNPTVWGIGDELQVNSEQGNMIGPTEHAVTGEHGPDQEVPGLMERDPTAEWSDCAETVNGSCVPGIINSCAPGLCPSGPNGTSVYETHSPRIVPIPLFDMDSFFASDPNGQTSVTITNIAGFFVEGLGGESGRDVIGRLVSYPGLTQGNSNVDETAAYLRQVILVR